MTHIKHSLFHIPKAIPLLRNQYVLLCQLRSLIQQTLLNSLHIHLKSYPSMILLSVSKKIFLPNGFSLDLHTLQHQQTQDLALKIVYHWIRHNAKPESPTPLIHGSPFLHAYYKIYSRLFIDESTNLIGLYTIYKNLFLIHNLLQLHP